ncbi:MAG: M48 family metallopeptidase [Desulfosalsimonas sp.]
MAAPKQMDYILLHDLVHIKHPNHGRRFWDELNRLIGDAKAPAWDLPAVQ